MAGNSVSSSILTILESHFTTAAVLVCLISERVPTFMLDSIANRYLDKNSNLFIKIDAQGYEWRMLDGVS
jgi:hypothetical protein